MEEGLKHYPQEGIIMLLLYSADKNIKKAKVTSNPIVYNNGSAIIPVNGKDFTLTMHLYFIF